MYPKSRNTASKSLGAYTKFINLLKKLFFHRSYFVIGAWLSYRP